MTKTSGLEHFPDDSIGEPWEPVDAEDSMGIIRGNRIRLKETAIDGSVIEGVVEGFSKKGDTKQVILRLDKEPNKVGTFVLGYNMEKIS